MNHNYRNTSIFPRERGRSRFLQCLWTSGNKQQLGQVWTSPPQIRGRLEGGGWGWVGNQDLGLTFKPSWLPSFALSNLLCTSTVLGSYLCSSHCVVPAVSFLFSAPHQSMSSWRAGNKAIQKDVFIWKQLPFAFLSTSWAASFGMRKTSG